jgi:hypothetical protein
MNSFLAARSLYQGDVIFHPACLAPAEKRGHLIVIAYRLLTFTIDPFVY